MSHVLERHVLFCQWSGAGGQRAATAAEASEPLRATFEEGLPPGLPPQFLAPRGSASLTVAPRGPRSPPSSWR